MAPRARSFEGNLAILNSPLVISANVASSSLSCRLLPALSFRSVCVSLPRVFSFHPKVVDPRIFLIKGKSSFPETRSGPHRLRLHRHLCLGRTEHDHRTCIDAALASGTVNKIGSRPQTGRPRNPWEHSSSHSLPATTKKPKDVPRSAMLFPSGKPRANSLNEGLEQKTHSLGVEAAIF